MPNAKEKMIAYLLEHANPSIKRRVRSEVLGDLAPKEARQYQNQIMQEPNILQIIAAQKENGWIGRWCHGSAKGDGPFANQETATKYLAEKAVDKDTPVLKRAMDAYAAVPLDDECYRTGGKIIDEFRHAAGGMNLIRCACVARAGYGDVMDISPQIQLSLDSFRRVLEVDSALDIARPIRGGKQWVFKEGEKWPCRYHLDILAHTESWKNEKNSRMIADSVAKMMKTDRPDLIGFNPAIWVGHALGPLGAFPSQGYSIKSSFILPAQVIASGTKPACYRLEYTEWLARCGAAPYLPVLGEAAEEIAAAVDDSGVANLPVYDWEFKSWGPYVGVGLETDWKTAVRRNCDITFRALLILHYADA